MIWTKYGGYQTNKGTHLAIVSEWMGNLEPYLSSGFGSNTEITNFISSNTNALMPVNSLRFFFANDIIL